MGPLLALVPLMHTSGAIDPFWVIVVYAFVFGLAALGAWVFYYWLFVIPKKVLPPRELRQERTWRPDANAPRAQKPRTLKGTH